MTNKANEDIFIKIKRSNYIMPLDKNIIPWSSIYKYVFFFLSLNILFELSSIFMVEALVFGKVCRPLDSKEKFKIRLCE